MDVILPEDPDAAQLVTIEGWRAIDRLERERGRDEQRPRVKLASRDELLSAAAATPAGSAAALS